jgi:hypothetical protein
MRDSELLPYNCKKKMATLSSILEGMKTTLSRDHCPQKRLDEIASQISHLHTTHKNETSTKQRRLMKIYALYVAVNTRPWKDVKALLRREVDQAPKLLEYMVEFDDKRWDQYKQSECIAYLLHVIRTQPVPTDPSTLQKMATPLLLRSFRDAMIREQGLEWDDALDYRRALLQRGETGYLATLLSCASILLEPNPDVPVSEMERMMMITQVLKIKPEEYTVDKVRVIVASLQL